MFIEIASLIFYTSTFISGAIFGILLTVICGLYLLADHHPRSSNEFPLKDNAISENIRKARKVMGCTELDSNSKEMTSKSALKLSRVVDHLEEFNFPLNRLRKELSSNIANNVSFNQSILDNKMKTIADSSTVNRLEKDLQETVSFIKDQRL